MSGGSVYDYLHKKNSTFKLPEIVKVAMDISKGMNYLHQNNIIHRDLKTANLLMDENKASFFSQSRHSYYLFDWKLENRSFLIPLDLKTLKAYILQVVKVADFGVARVKDQSGVMTAETGTYRWMAPEVQIIHMHISYKKVKPIMTNIQMLLNFRSLNISLTITKQMFLALQLFCGSC